MNREETIEYLKKENIDFTLIEHPAVFTVEEADRLTLPHREAHAKNLFIRDEKKRNYYLITLKEDKVLDLKDLRRRFGTKPLSFASAEDLEKILGVQPGSVSALALLNDREHNGKHGNNLPQDGRPDHTCKKKRKRCHSSLIILWHILRMWSKLQI